MTWDKQPMPPLRAQRILDKKTPTRGGHKTIFLEENSGDKFIMLRSKSAV
jgi:hypothetical protein